MENDLGSVFGTRLESRELSGGYDTRRLPQPQSEREREIFILYRMNMCTYISESDLHPFSLLADQNASLNLPA